MKVTTSILLLAGSFSSIVLYIDEATERAVVHRSPCGTRLHIVGHLFTTLIHISQREVKPNCSYSSCLLSLNICIIFSYDFMLFSEHGHHTVSTLLMIKLSYAQCVCAMTCGESKHTHTFQEVCWHLSPVNQMSVHSLHPTVLRALTWVYYMCTHKHTCTHKQLISLWIVFFISHSQLTELVTTPYRWLSLPKQWNVINIIALKDYLSAIGCKLFLNAKQICYIYWMSMSGKVKWF